MISSLVATSTGADHLAVPLGGLDRDHPLSAAAVTRVFGVAVRCTKPFSVAVQHGLSLAVGDQHRDHAPAFADLHAAHPGAPGVHRPHVRSPRSATPCRRSENSITSSALPSVIAARSSVVAVVQLDRDDPLLARIEYCTASFSSPCRASREEHEILSSYSLTGARR